MQICSQCVMDTSDSAIVFDKNGVCNHCHAAQNRIQEELLIENREQRLYSILQNIRKRGKDKPYDCIIGLSGGVDSSYLAYLVKKKFQLRPLAIHFDNGWNSELSVSNIEQLVHKLKLDYFNYVMDWQVFKNLQLAFLKSSIANTEIPTDHAIIALLFQTAAKHKIKYIILGSNLATESIMPDSWMYDNRDWKFIKSVNKAHGLMHLKGYPHYTLLRMFYYVFIKKIKFVPLLNYIDYNKQSAKETLIEELGWRDYGGKHFESIFTRFFQAYLLPKKFNMDKRKPHLSSLINSKQISRIEALRILEKPPYEYENVAEDLEYVSKKFNLTKDMLEDILQLPPATPYDYSNHSWLFKKQRLLKLIKSYMIGK